MIFRMANCSVSRRELKKTKNIHSNKYKKHDYSSSNSSISDSDSYLSIEIGREERRQNNELKYTNKLYYVVKNVIKNKDQHKDAIEYKPKFDSKFSLSSKNKEPLPVVTVSLLECKKYREAIISGLTCLWYIWDTNSMIKRWHTKH